MAQVAEQTTDLVNPFFLSGNEPGVTGPREPFAVPERETAYPEPSMFGLLPAAAIYARHIRNLAVHDVTVRFVTPDERPAVVLEDVAGARFHRLDTTRAPAAQKFVLRSVRDCAVRDCVGIADSLIEDP
jgi:hypothetical protein